MGWLTGWVRGHWVLTVLALAAAAAAVAQARRPTLEAPPPPRPPAPPRPGPARPDTRTGEDARASAMPDALERPAGARNVTATAPEPAGRRPSAAGLASTPVPSQEGEPTLTPQREVVEGVEPGPYPGSALPRPDGSAPAPEYTVKATRGSMRCHSPDSPYFRRTRAGLWFRSEEEAVAAGFRPWSRR